MSGLCSAHQDHTPGCVQCEASWVNVYDRRPEDGQEVIGLWIDGTQGPVTFYAWDAPDGPERWKDSEGFVDEPYLWRPGP